MKLVSLQHSVEDYLKRMHTTGDDVAFFGLLDLGPPALPLLMAEAEKPENKTILPRLVEVIWQYRVTDAIGFLGRMLCDPNPLVWKESLDGLVAIGGSDAIRWMRDTRNCVESGDLVNGLSAEWLDEAIDQIESRSSL
jgi:hypothetical protein